MFSTIVYILLLINVFVLGLSYGFDNDVLDYVSVGMSCLIGVLLYFRHRQHIAQKVSDQSDGCE